MKKNYETISFVTKARLNLTAFVLLTTCLLFNSARAQSFAIVGNGVTYNTTTSYPAPYGNYYYGARHQFMVTAAELNSAGVVPSASILSVGFNVFASNNLAHIGWTVKVYTTTSTSALATAYVSSGQVSQSVPSNYNPVLGWNQTAVTPFVWNGLDHLVVEVCFNNTSFVTNAQTYWSTNLTGGFIYSRYNYADAAGQCALPGGNTSTTTRPNIRFEWDLIPCSGQPSANSVNAPTFAICPNSTVALGLTNTYTVGGLVYTWQTSTMSAVGPYSTVATSSTAPYNTPALNVPTWYQVIVTCPGQGSIVTTAGTVMIASPTTSTVPYLEDFEQIGIDDRLPNCSWSATGMLTTTRTYTASNTGNRIPKSGTSFAAFRNSPAGSSYYFTNGIQMEPNITYSAGVWYTTDLTGANNWTNLSIMIGTSQSTTGLTTIATTGGSAISPIYKLLSNTYTVGTSGLYYIVIKATGANGTAQYLSWDDLFITIPCSLNTTSVTISASSNTICSGSSVMLTASGANTYLWSNGATTAVITDTPSSSTNYGVTGTKTITGCPGSSNISITVKPSPNLAAASFPAAVCKGKSSTLQASGAANYLWSNSATGAITTVTPAANSTYSVVGTSTNNCSRTAVVAVTVLNLPTVTATSSRNNVCQGEAVLLTASGASQYQWVAPTSQVFSGTSIPQTPAVPGGQYTVTGTDGAGCSNTYFLNISVDPCVGIDASSTARFEVYPNPTSGEIMIGNSASVTVELADLTGKILLRETNTGKLNISHLPAGVYYLKITSASGNEVVKIIKQ
jgi:hypothetical protein